MSTTYSQCSVLRRATPRVLISIVNWNHALNTAKCVRSLENQTYRNYDVVVVDNGSRDDSVDVLRREIPAVTIIESDENLGFAGGHALSVAYAEDHGYDLIWLLNNDAIADENALGSLVTAYLEQPRAVFGSLILDANCKYIHFGGGHSIVGGDICWQSQYDPLHGAALSVCNENETFQSSHVGGASMLVPMCISKEYGFMDLAFFLYGEEVDYCYRLWNEHRIPSMMVPASRVAHSAGGSFMNSYLGAVRQYYLTRNVLYLKRKYRGLPIVSFREGLIVLKVLTVRLFFRNKEINLEFLVWYMENLAKMHAFLGVRGKQVDPDNYL